MPEGPSIVILREQVTRFTGQFIRHAEGNAKIDKDRLRGQPVDAFRSWGKHFLIQLPDHALRVHFLMFGSYTIDVRKPREARLSLGFAGVGNIIKNEVLFRVRVQPLSRVGSLAPAKLRQLVAEARRARRPLQHFLGEVAGLGRRLGPLLVQLPPSLDFDARIARSFFGLLRELHRGAVVCEPRHATWFTPRVDALLARHGIARTLCRSCSSSGDTRQADSARRRPHPPAVHDRRTSGQT